MSERPTLTDDGAAALAAEALRHVASGQVVGLGTGHAATAFVRALGARVAAGLDVRGVPTSEATAALARSLGIKLLSPDDVETIGLSSTARSPVRVTIEVPLEEADALALLLAEAQRLIDTLRQGLGMVPDSLPEVL